jgi:ATP-dependent DNA helicase RecG
MKFACESEILENKRSAAELKKEAIISIVAIFNKHGSGDLYFGIRNDGLIVGQMVSVNTLREVSQAIANHIEPNVYPEVSEAVIDDKQCICVSFSGIDAPYFAYGRAYIRVADEDKQMSKAELESKP